MGIMGLDQYAHVSYVDRLTHSALTDLNEV